MGYTTKFRDDFKLNKPLDAELHQYLIKFSKTQRIVRILPPEYGIEGEFYVNDDKELEQDIIIDCSRPPKTQPGLWCKWVPNEDGTAIKWNGAEKFYDYIEWIEYLIRTFLAPKGYILNGNVYWYGERIDDFGVIEIINNVIYVKRGKHIYE